MAELFNHLKKKKFPKDLLTTYNIGLLQTQAFKFVMSITTIFLKQFQLSNVEWVMLGILRDSPKGVRSLALAEILAVEQPYITVATKHLLKKGLISVVTDKVDKRAKIFSITKKGSTLVSKVEKGLEKEMDQIADGMVLDDVATYIKVMHSIAGKLKTLK